MPREEQLEGYIDRLDRESYTVFILPSLPCDLKIIMYNSECKRVPATWGAILAAAGFLVCFRGLPLSEVDIEANGENSRVRFSDLDGKMSITLPKCKQLLEKTQIFSGNVEKTIKKLKIKSPSVDLISAKTCDTDLFDGEHLLSLLLAEGGVDLALAYSVEGNTIRTKFRAARPISDVALISALAAYASVGERGRYRILSSEEKITLEATYDGIRVSLPPPRFMRFDTPYL